jgi:uncharacterized membrane protein (GlpM family)
MSELLVRALIGGMVVAAFAQLGDLFKPKRFAGLFGAAPSVALASLALVAAKKGNEYAATEARSMMIGAVAFLAYAYGISRLMLRYKPSAMWLTLAMLPLWLGISLGVWFVWLR